MARTPKAPPNGEGEEEPRKRRSKWAADLEHHVPGSAQMSNAELETWLDWLTRPR